MAVGTALQAGCTRAPGAVDIPNSASPAPHWGSNTLQSDVTVRATTTADAHCQSPGPRSEPVTRAFLSPQSSTLTQVHCSLPHVTTKEAEVQIQERPRPDSKVGAFTFVGGRDTEAVA